MSIALVIVKKDMGGHVWSNTHAVRIAAGGDGIPSDADLTSIGAAGTFTAAQTASGGATNFLQRLISFERMMHGPAVHFNQVYLTDGKNNKEPGAPTVYATKALDLVGLSAQFSTGATIYEPGGVTWLINRVISGYSHKPGRMFLRGCLPEAAIQLNGPRMVDWESTAQQSAFATVLSGAVTGSGIGTHFDGGTNAAVALYAVPHYKSLLRDAAVGLEVGDLGTVLPCSGFVSMYPCLRQVKRGRKKKAV